MMLNLKINIKINILYALIIFFFVLQVGYDIAGDPRRGHINLIIEALKTNIFNNNNNNNNNKILSNKITIHTAEIVRKLTHVNLSRVWCIYIYIYIYIYLYLYLFIYLYL